MGMQETRSRTPGSAAEATAMEDPRKEARCHIAIPVKVFPDIRSNESQSCCTYEISLAGARLAALPGVKQIGQVIWLQRHNRRARYKVVWIGQPGSSQAGQVGVE